MEKHELYGSTSYCHRTKSIIVRSRQGGFVTQNCVHCGKPRAIKIEELPPWFCELCNMLCERIVNINKNYAYKCPKCKKEIEVAKLVPHWDDLFDEWGYALEDERI